MKEIEFKGKVINMDDFMSEKRIVDVSNSIKVDNYGNVYSGNKSMRILSERNILVKDNDGKYKANKAFVIYYAFTKKQIQIGDCIVFLDGNKDNCRMDNIVVKKYSDIVNDVYIQTKQGYPRVVTISRNRSVNLLPSQQGSSIKSYCQTMMKTLKNMVLSMLEPSDVPEPAFIIYESICRKDPGFKNDIPFNLFLDLIDGLTNSQYKLINYRLIDDGGYVLSNNGYISFNTAYELSALGIDEPAFMEYIYDKSMPSRVQIVRYSESTQYVYKRIKAYTLNSMIPLMNERFNVVINIEHLDDKYHSFLTGSNGELCNEHAQMEFFGSFDYVLKAIIEAFFKFESSLINESESNGIVKEENVCQIED